MWRRGHPWAAVYDFFVERELLSRTLGRLVFGTDTGRLYEGAGAIGSLPHGSSILDIPCGGGVAFRGLRPGQRVRYVAADIAPDMLERASREAARRGLDQVTFMEADAQNLPFADGEFDLVLSFTGLHCFPDPRAAVLELGRCLAPGGELVGSAFLAGMGLRYEPLARAGRLAGLMGPSGTPQQVSQWLAEAGLTEITLECSGALGYFSARAPA